MVQKKKPVLAWVLGILFVIFGLGMWGVHKSLKNPAQSAIAFTQTATIDGTLLPKERVIADFNLTDIQGKAFHKANLLGHWTLLFFGFTNCGFVCPTTMAELNLMYQSLQKDKDTLPQIVMISVDPSRDSVARLKEYVQQFNPAFFGARGDMAQIDALATQMNVTFSKIEANDGNKNHYTITHSAEIMVLDPKGNLVAFLSYPHKSAVMAKDFKTIQQLYQKANAVISR